jgi:SIR2-like domain
MDIVFFFGAGVSVPSGLPTASGVTNALLSIDTDRKNAEQVAILKAMYELYEAHMSGQGMFQNGDEIASTGPAFKSAFATYEDIHLICSEIGFWELGRSENPMVFSFLQSLADHLSTEEDRRPKSHKLFDLCQKGNMACDYIESKLVELLKRPYIAGFEAIGELARQSNVRGISIFTLNHDTLIEQYLSREGIMYSDGFGEVDGDLRWPDSGKYEDTANKVDIFKLHGAVDWYRFRREGKFEIGIATKDITSSLFDSKGAKLAPMRDLPWFLTGKDKSAMYHYGVLNNLFFRFAQTLKHSRRIVMSGYGWGDFTINSFIVGWLEASSDNRLILLHREIEVLLNSSDVFHEGYRGWVASGQVKVIPQWLSEVTGADVLAWL